MAAHAWKPRSLRWQISKPFGGADDLAEAVATTPLVAQVLHNRGVDDPNQARAFMSPKLTDLHSPETLPGVSVAARRIARAIAASERIVIYGDYDVDGITAIAILRACLKLLDADVHYYVPHRLEEGYGVNTDAIARIIDDGTQLLITVDCGISATGPLKAAAAAGVDVIITDHHSPPEELPPAVAIVHPALPGSDYPNPNLAGAGVAFKLAWQVAREVCGENRVDEPMRKFLLESTCLAALGTVADVVPLIDENRAIVTYGLRGLPATSHPGLKALLQSTRLLGRKLDAYHIGFMLAPRLNACGRMGHARLAVEMLTDAPADRCTKIAEHLEQQNSKRKQIEQSITEQAAEMVTLGGLDGENSKAIVLASDKWHGGVIGIVASRLVDKFNRPTVLIAINGDGCGQGSARSVAGFHMRDALAACSEYLTSFGGHAMAGGLRIEYDRIVEFTAAFNEYAKNHTKEAQLQPMLRIDAETTISALSYKAVEHLERLVPFGEGNPPPAVAIRSCKVLSPPRRIGRGGNTASLVLGQDGSTIRAVGFGMGDLADHLVGIDIVDIAGRPILNHFNGITSVELKLLDVQWSR